MAKFFIQKEGEEQYSWMLKEDNDDILLTSEPFTTRENCVAGIEDSKKHIGERNFKDLLSVRNEPYFTQIGGNYQVLGTSPMYMTDAEKDAGIENVKRKAPSASIEDVA